MKKLLILFVFTVNSLKLLSYGKQEITIDNKTGLTLFLQFGLYDKQLNNQAETIEYSDAIPPKSQKAISLDQAQGRNSEGKSISTDFSKAMTLQASSESYGQERIPGNIKESNKIICKRSIEDDETLSCGSNVLAAYPAEFTSKFFPGKNIPSTFPNKIEATLNFSENPYIPIKLK